MKNTTYTSENEFLPWEENVPETNYENDGDSINNEKIEENSSYDTYNFFPDAAF